MMMVLVLGFMGFMYMIFDGLWNFVMLLGIVFISVFFVEFLLVFVLLCWLKFLGFEVVLKEDVFLFFVIVKV